MNIKIEYLDNYTYTNSSTITTVNIEKYDTIINLTTDSKEAYYGDPILLTAYITDNLAHSVNIGKVIFYYYDTSKQNKELKKIGEAYINPKKNTASIKFIPKRNGAVIAEYKSENDYYNDAGTDKCNTVLYSLVNKNVDVTIEELENKIVYYSESTTIKAKVSRGIDNNGNPIPLTYGTVTFVSYQDDDVTGQEIGDPVPIDENGEATIVYSPRQDVEPTNPVTEIIYAIFNKDNTLKYFNDARDKINLTVKGASNVSIAVSALNLYVDGFTTLTTNFKSDSSTEFNTTHATYKLYVDNEVNSGYSLTKTTDTFNITGLSEGAHTIYVKGIDSTNHDVKSNTINLLVIKREPTFEIGSKKRVALTLQNIPDGMVNDCLSFVVTSESPDLTEGGIYFKIITPDGEDLLLDAYMSKSVASIKHCFRTVGTYSIIAYYNGSATIYPTNSLTKYFVIRGSNDSLNTNIEIIRNEYPGIINVKYDINTDTTKYGTITTTLNSSFNKKHYTQSLNAPTGTFTFDNLIPDTYELQITANGFGLTNQANQTTKNIVIKRASVTSGNMGVTSCDFGSSSYAYTQQYLRADWIDNYAAKNNLNFQKENAEIYIYLSDNELTIDSLNNINNLPTNSSGDLLVYKFNEANLLNNTKDVDNLDGNTYNIGSYQLRARLLITLKGGMYYIKTFFKGNNYYEDYLTPFTTKGARLIEKPKIKWIQSNFGSIGNDGLVQFQLVHNNDKPLTNQTVYVNFGYKENYGKTPEKVYTLSSGNDGYFSQEVTLNKVQELYCYASYNGLSNYYNATESDVKFFTRSNSSPTSSTPSTPSTSPTESSSAQATSLQWVYFNEGIPPANGKAEVKLLNSSGTPINGETVNINFARIDGLESTLSYPLTTPPSGQVSQTFTITRNDVKLKCWAEYAGKTNKYKPCSLAPKEFYRMPPVSTVTKIPTNLTITNFNPNGGQIKGTITLKLTNANTNDVIVGYPIYLYCNYANSNDKSTLQTFFNNTDTKGEVSFEFGFVQKNQLQCYGAFLGKNNYGPSETEVKYFYRS